MLSLISLVRTSVLVVGIFAVVLGSGSQKAGAILPPFNFFLEFFNSLGLAPAECQVSPVVLNPNCKQKKIDKAITKSERRITALAEKLEDADDERVGSKKAIRKQERKLTKLTKKLDRLDPKKKKNKKAIRRLERQIDKVEARLAKLNERKKGDKKLIRRINKKVDLELANLLRKVRRQIGI